MIIPERTPMKRLLMTALLPLLLTIAFLAADVYNSIHRYDIVRLRSHSMWKQCGGMACRPDVIFIGPDDRLAGDTLIIQGEPLARIVECRFASPLDYSGASDDIDVEILDTAHCIMTYCGK
ncbi:MAG: hypothetical protein ABI876_13625 [Bacteroidota bacterium]